MESRTDLRDALPEVLLLETPPAFTILGEHHFSSPKFRYLKPYEADPPPADLDSYFATRARHVRAVVVSRLGKVDARLLGLLPSLGIVVTTSAGLNQVDLPECRRRGIRITNAGNVYSADAADLAVGLLFDILRRVSAGHRYVVQGLWGIRGDFSLGSKIGGKKVGVVGLGMIGREVAKRLEAFRCGISYTSRKRKPDVPYPFYENVLELASNCDALIICCGLTDQTRYMVNKEVFSALGKEGVVINIGRGAIIDEKEMVRCLVEGEIAGAGLDVFEHEPHVPKELLQLDNVVLSPHRTVLTPKETLEDLSKLVVGNLEAFFENGPLLSEYTDD